MAAVSSETIHATCVAIDGRAVLIEGRSGAGKSDLALRLIDRGAVLVSDDRTLVLREGSGGVLLASPPATIAGKIEVRGVGIVAMPHRERVPVALIVTLAEEIERLPDDPPPTRHVAGVAVPVRMLEGMTASAPIKLELALKALTANAH